MNHTYNIKKIYEYTSNKLMQQQNARYDEKRNMIYALNLNLGTWKNTNTIKRVPE